MAGHHEGGMLAAGADYHAAVEGRQGGVAGVSGSLTALDQDGAQPAIAMPGFGAATFTGTFVATGRHPGPAGQMRTIRKAAHVGANLGHDGGGSDSFDAWYGAQLLNLLSERDQMLLDS